MSRAELAEAVNDYLWRSTGKRYALDAHAIARYERGKVGWPGAAYRAGLKAVLGVAGDAELGFQPTPRGSSTAPSSSPGPRESDKRRSAADVVLSTSGNAQDAVMEPASHPTSSPADVSHRGVADVVSVLAPGQSAAGFLADTVVETPVPTRVGWTDVQYVRRATRAIAMSENLFGGGLCCEAAASQLRWVGSLLEARATNDVRRAMFEAVGNLSSVVAYSAFDIANYTAADRYFHFALWCADRAGAWALRANTLAEMARKAAYIGELDDAFTLVEFAQVRDDRLSATARAMLWTLRARIRALTSRTTDIRPDIDRADGCFADRVPEQEPPWLCYYDEAEHQGSTGKALIPLALHVRRPELAKGRMSAAIRLHDAHYPRSRVFSRVRLASLLLTAGDPQEAVVIGRQALTDAESLRSTRITRELEGLQRAARPHARNAEVAELSRDVAAAVTATT